MDETAHFDKHTNTPKYAQICPKYYVKLLYKFKTIEHKLANSSTLLMIR